jgi:hypothetical protein
VCKALDCEAEDGFETLPLLKAHFDLAHAANASPTEAARRTTGKRARTATLQEDTKPVTMVSNARREVIITPSGQQYVWQRKKYIRKQRPKLPRRPKPKEEELQPATPATPASSSIPQAILETLNMPRRHLLQCHVCADFTCRNQLDLESHRSG